MQCMMNCQPQNRKRRNKQLSVCKTDQKYKQFVKVQFYELFFCVFTALCVITYLNTNFLRRKYELMANKKCAALTKQQLEEIITTMRSGGAGFRKNEQIATALLL